MTDHHSRTRVRSGLVLILLLLLAAGAAWWLFRPSTDLDTVDPSLDRARAIGVAERLAEAAADGSFRVVLTGDDLAHLLRDAVRGSPLALSALEVTVADSERARARLEASGRLSGSGLPISATLLVHHEAPRFSLEATDTHLAGLGLPGAVRRALDEQLDGSVDLGGSLVDEGVHIDAVDVEDSALVLTGRATRPDEVAAQLRGAFGGDAGSRPAPPERVGRGRAEDDRVAGAPLVLALGDSLAAGTGSADHRDGVAARLHSALERRRGRELGYLNLAEPGATARTVVDGGQLARARTALAERPVELVLVSVGANELLALLDDGPCSEDLGASACEDALDEAATGLGAGLDELLPALRAAGAGELVVLAPYNPFSVGVGGRAEQRTDAAVARLGAVARAAAERHGATMADPAPEFARRAGSLTRLGSSPPDIHPTPRGHDTLAHVVLEALEG